MRWREGGMELGDSRVSRASAPLLLPQMSLCPPRVGSGGCVDRTNRPALRACKVPENNPSSAQSSLGSSSPIPRAEGTVPPGDPAGWGARRVGGRQGGGWGQCSFGLSTGLSRPQALPLLSIQAGLEVHNYTPEHLPSRVFRKLTFPEHLLCTGAEPSLYLN